MKRLFFITAILSGIFAQGQIDPNAPKKFYTGVATDSIFAIDDTIHIKDLSNFPKGIQTTTTIIYENTGEWANLKSIVDTLSTRGMIVLKRGATYVQNDPLVIKDVIVIEGNGATLKRANDVLTTLSAPASTGDTQITVNMVPSTWQVGDRLQIFEDNTYSTSTLRITLEISNITGNTITLTSPIKFSDGVSPYTWPIGASVRKVYAQIQTVSAGSLLTYKVNNLTIDGNKANNSANSYWAVNSGIRGEASATFDRCKIINQPNDAFLGSGYTIKNSLIKDVNLAFVHYSVNKLLFPKIGGEIHGNIVRNVGLIDNVVSGHTEGVINFSFNSGKVHIHDNRFLAENSVVPILGAIKGGKSTGEKGADKQLFFHDNYVEGFDGIMYSLTTDEIPPTGIVITNNVFRDCGIQDWGSYSIFDGYFKFYDNHLTGNTIVNNIPANFKLDNGELFPGDNISELVNDEGYLKPSDSPTITGRWAFGDFIELPNGNSSGMLIGSSSISSSFFGTRYGSRNPIISGNANPDYGQDSWSVNYSGISASLLELSLNGNLLLYSTSGSTPSGNFTSFWGTPKTVATQEWVSSQSYASNLTDLGDTNITTPASAGQVLQYDGANWVNSDTPGSTLLLHEQTITSTELQNIGTTPLELIAAPGAGKIIVVERVVAKMEAQTTAYDFTNGLQMVYDTYSDAIATFNNTFANSILDSYVTVDGGSVPAQPNAGVFLEAVSNPTQGDGILHLKIYYRIVEF